MDIGITFAMAIVLFIIGIIVKYLTDINFNGLVAVLGTLTFVIPFFIALYNIMNNPNDAKVVADNINFYIESFANFLPGAIIGDIVALLFSPIIDALK